MRLIRGAPGSGKTQQVFQEFAQAPANSRIVVPTATLVRHYQHELARAGLVFNPHQIVSLSRFAQDCAPDLKLAPASLIRALTRDALTRLQLPEFTQVAATRGMTDIVLENITRFENDGITPDRPPKGRALTAHAKAFFRVWKDIATALAQRGFATRGQLFRRAAKSVTTGAVCPTNVWMDGFLKFSPLESDFLRAVAAACDLTLTLTEGPSTFDAMRFATELGAKQQLLPTPQRRTEITAVTAPSPEREADEIARRILELNARGTEFPAIAVALRDVESWLPLIKSTFDRFGIPARYYFSTPVRKHPVAIFLDGLVSCALNDWDFNATLTALRAHPAWGHTAAFDRFDFHVRDKMPGHGARELLAICEPGPLQNHIADCLKVDKWRGDRLRPAAWQQRFEQLAATLYRTRTIPEPTDYADVESARSHAAALRAWSEALETATTFYPPAEPLSLDQFHAIVSDALETAGMQIPDNRHNVVHVMSAFEARQWQVRSLFICGMTAKDYPRAAAPNLLFPDDPEEKDEEQLFDILKARAKENLILSVSRRDTSGKTVVPSENFVGHALACPQVVPEQRQNPSTQSNPTPIKGLTELHKTIALTHLEDLAKCRFRFFAGKTLRLKTIPDRPEARLGFRTVGLIIHHAMELWLADRRQDFVDLFELTFDEFRLKYNYPPGYKLEVERIQLRRVAREVSAAVHWPFESSEAEVECDFDFPGGVTITCRLDRIDNLGAGNCIIVDYKSGKVANVDKLVESETSLQGPLYALAVREKKNLNTVAMVYIAVREGRTIGWGQIPGIDLELLPMPENWIDNARDRIIERLQSFLQGDVHAEPTTKDDCTWCDYRGTCRIDEQTETVTIGVAGA